MPLSLFRDIADIIFPPRCVTCNVLLDEGEGPHFCSVCTGHIGFIGRPLCPRCGVPFAGGDTDDHLCGDCLMHEPPFSIARALGRYEGTLLHAIHRFKYGGKIALGEILGALMAEFPYPRFSFAHYSLLIPVPLHPKRLRQRMFNQSVILARTIGKHVSLPLEIMTLRRSVYTEPQVNLGKSERKLNVSGAFVVDRADRIVDERIILVDDVYTTGSTVKECATALKKSGAEEVAVLTLARAV